MISRNNKIAIIGAGYMAEEYLKVLSKKKFGVKQFTQQHFPSVKD